LANEYESPQGGASMRLIRRILGVSMIYLAGIASVVYGQISGTFPVPLLKGKIHPLFGFEHLTYVIVIIMIIALAIVLLVPDRD
jgi:ABC-type phosphate transport system permease subunit